MNAGVVMVLGICVTVLLVTWIRRRWPADGAIRAELAELKARMAAVERATSPGQAKEEV